MILGSGSTVPHAGRASSGYWLETRGGGKLLLDCSASIQSRAAANGLPWPELDAIWISHFHLDHCGGLPPFLQSTKHAPEMKGREKPLRIFGPVGLAALIDRMSAVNNYRLLEQPFPLEIVEVGPLEPFEIVPNLVATAMETPHTPESLALHMRDSDDKTLVFTSDTAFDETLATLANRCDLLLMECTFVRDKPVKKHLELAEAMRVTRKASPGRVVLTHLYPEWDEVDITKEAAKFSPPCEVLLAEDGLVLEV